MKKQLLALTISSLFALSANAAVSGCPSGWVKSGDGKECVLTEKVDTPAIGTSDTTRPICINGFTYESSTNKCSKTVNANTTNLSKIFPYISDLKIGRFINTEDTSPYCSDSSYTLSASKDKCTKVNNNCPSGSSLVGSNCVYQTASKPVNYIGCTTANSGGSWTQFTASGQDWWTVQARCSSDGSNIEIYADGAGSKGNGGTAGYWKKIPIGNYNGYYAHVVTPHWGGLQRIYYTRVSGGCSNGTCRYDISFDQGSFNMAYQVCTTQYNWWDSYNGTTTCNWQSANIQYLWQCLEYDSYYGSCNRYAQGSDAVASLNSTSSSGFTTRTTLVFSQYASSPCDPGYVQENGVCVKKVYPTQSVTELPSSCSSYPIPSGAQNAGTSLINLGGYHTCRTTFYSCPSGKTLSGTNCI